MHGREFALVERRSQWRRSLVHFLDVAGELTSVPAQWTSIIPPDPLLAMSAGRSALRVADLLELARLIKALEAGRRS